MRFLACGDRAVLVELDDGNRRRRLDTLLRHHPVAGMVEHVPGDRTVLVVVERPEDLARVVGAVGALDLDAVAPTSPAQEPDGRLRVDVTYDGPDLAAVADLLGISEADVVDRHTSQVWVVEFAGFAPGFGYLTGQRGGLDVPRRADPRTRIPPGSVGLAGAYSGIYPRPSPGGWQLIGHTELAMWDPDRDPPALLTPGREVEFVRVAT